MSFPGTVVTSMGQGATAAKSAACQGTDENFDGSTGQQRMGNARGVLFHTSTPIRAEAGQAQAQASPISANRRDIPPCIHLEDGMCQTHGKKALWLFKPTSVVNRRTGKRTTKKLWGWHCDVNLTGDKTLKQTRLSFVRNPAADVSRGLQNTRGGDDTTTTTSSFSTPTRGQNTVELNNGE